MSDVDITSKTMDGMGPHGTKVGLLRVLGPAHVWALGVGIVLVGEYMGWNFAVGKGGAYAALIACWFAGILYTCVAMIDSEVTSTVASAGGQYTQAKHIIGPLMAFNVGLYLVFAYTMLEAANAITAGYLFSVVATMSGHEAALDQRPFIILVIMFPGLAELPRGAGDADLQPGHHHHRLRGHPDPVRVDLRHPRRRDHGACGAVRGP
jgi:ethanolamine permease